MPPEHAEVLRWLERARSDRSVARRLFESQAPELEVAAFHCQQAVEKLLQAYLVSAQVEFEKVHDLGRLAKSCARVAPEFADLRSDVEPLSQYTVVSRYPGPPVPNRQAVERALKVVERVWDLVTQRVPPEAVPPTNRS